MLGGITDIWLGRTEITADTAFNRLSWMAESPVRPQSLSTFRAPSDSSEEDGGGSTGSLSPDALSPPRPLQSQYDLRSARFGSASTPALATGTFRAPDASLDQETPVDPD